MRFGSLARRVGAIDHVFPLRINVSFNFCRSDSVLHRKSKGLASASKGCTASMASSGPGARILSRAAAAASGPPHHQHDLYAYCRCRRACRSPGR
jgi:hypothetical protein